MNDAVQRPQSTHNSGTDLCFKLQNIPGIILIAKLCKPRLGYPSEYNNFRLNTQMNTVICHKSENTITYLYKEKFTNYLNKMISILPHFLEVKRN